MFIFKGKNRIDCSIDFSKERFVEVYKQGFVLEKLDIHDAYKEYRKQYNKLNPEVKESFIKKKKKKEA